MPEPKVHALDDLFDRPRCGAKTDRFATSRSKVTCRRCIQLDPGPFVIFHTPRRTES